MSNRIDLPEQLGLFPLPGALLLPRAQLPLHVFEPRYVALIDDALRSDHRMIGMIQPLGDGLHKIGCAGRIIGFRETEDGRYLITLLGLSRFRLLSEIEGFTPFRRAQVSWAGFDRDQDRAPETDPAFDRKTLSQLMTRFFTLRDIDTDWDAIDDATDEMLINALSMLSPLGDEDKQALLEAPTLATRRETLEALVSYALHINDQETKPQ